MQVFIFCVFYKEKRDLEMLAFKEAKTKSRLTMCTFFSSFRYTMECSRTMGILIKIVRSFSPSPVLLCFAPSLRSSYESDVTLLLRCSVQVISFSERNLFMLKSFENIRERLV